MLGVGEDQGEPTKEEMLSFDRNKALVRRWLEEVYFRGDLDAGNGLFTSNYVLHDSSFPETCTARKASNRTSPCTVSPFPSSRSP
jgi:hypothetical protein